MFTRREFLKSSSLIALAPTVPAILEQTARAAMPQPDDRVLVVIQLDGGNDGLNMVVPFADEAYARHRRTLRLAEDRLLKLDDAIGLHPSMRGAADLFEDRRLAIVQGVGYPSPSRSHEVSMAIWQTARFDPEQHNSYGWIGCTLDEMQRRPPGAPDSAVVGKLTTPLALRGRKAAATSFDSIEEMFSSNDAGRALTEGQTYSEDLQRFLRRQTLDAYSTADLLSDLAGSRDDDSVAYPNTELARRLKLVAQLLKADTATRVYYTVQPGYDTHSTQLPVHARLLGELSGAMKAFLDDLRESKLDERVLVLCFSEFGRQVQENGSAGTDHGTAGPVLLAGGKLEGGIYGTPLNLLELDRNAPHFTTDFRAVYAAVIEQWLGLPSKRVLGGAFEPFSLGLRV